MKIGDECYVHGYVDEIRNDTIIIRNEGGYFGTAKSEVLTAPAEYVRVVRCKDCLDRREISAIVDILRNDRKHCE